jgi:hypothetical protein
MQADVPASKIRRVLPTAALLFGLIGLLELGWVWAENINAPPCGKPLTEHYFSIPSLLGFTLGLIAIIKNYHEKSASSVENVQGAIRTGRKWLAIIGITASAPGLLLTIASLPSCSIYATHICRVTEPTQILRTINRSQEQDFATRSRFATLEELAESGMVDTAIANGSPISGYIYSCSDITTKTYCVHADRANGKCGYRDFIVCEDGVIRFVESEAKGAVRRGEGQPMGVSH